MIRGGRPSWFWFGACRAFPAPPPQGTRQSPGEKKTLLVCPMPSPTQPAASSPAASSRRLPADTPRGSLPSVQQSLCKPVILDFAGIPAVVRWRRKSDWKGLVPSGTIYSVSSRWTRAGYTRTHMNTIHRQGRASWLLGGPPSEKIQKITAHGVRRWPKKEK